MDLTGKAFDKLRDFIKEVHRMHGINAEYDISDEFVDAFRIQFVEGTNTMDVVCPIDRLEGDESEVIEIDAAAPIANFKMVAAISLVVPVLINLAI